MFLLECTLYYRTPIKIHVHCTHSGHILKSHGIGLYKKDVLHHTGVIKGNILKNE